MNSAVLRITWRDRLRSAIGMFFYRRMGVKCGPFMFYSQGEWMFIDHIGNIWRITYTGDYRGCPLQISLFHEV